MRKMYNAYVAILSFLLKITPKFCHSWIWACIQLFEGYLFSGLRVAILRQYSNRIGDNIYIGKFVDIKNFHGIRIGNNVSIQKNCHLDAAGGIDIGDNVSIAHACSLISFEHNYIGDKPIKYNPALFRKIVISNDVWIGCGCRILSGANIGSRVVVAAGSVLTSKNPSQSNVILGGVPARIIKEI